MSWTGPSRASRTAWIPTVLALALGLGWATRELAFAGDQASPVTSQTVTLDQVKMTEFRYRGQAGRQDRRLRQRRHPGQHEVRDRPVRPRRRARRRTRRTPTPRKRS